jgi:hypothetical protein
MNTRLEIASRVLPGMVSHSGNYIFPDDKLARSAMNLADALIAAEEETRKPTSENPDYDVTVAHDFLVNDLAILREALNTMPTLPSKVVRSLDVILAKDKARKQGAIPQCGTIADYERDVEAAQAAYDANPNSRNASDLHAAKEALARRQQ